MKVVKLIIGVYAALSLIGAIFLFLHAQTDRTTLIAIYVLFNTSIIIIGLIFERGRYKPTIISKNSGWQLTGERFIDTTTGKTMEVRYNPGTGERDYIETNNQQS